MAGLIVIAMGLFSLLGAILDWDWYMNHRKARFIVKILGRKGARIFYAILGLGLIVLGVLLALGIVD
jgi:small neutral amino acid transporter SnatA (MarC family)